MPKRKREVSDTLSVFTNYISEENSIYDSASNSFVGDFVYCSQYVVCAITVYCVNGTGTISIEGSFDGDAGSGDVLAPASVSANTLFFKRVGLSYPYVRVRWLAQGVTTPVTTIYTVLEKQGLSPADTPLPTPGSTIITAGTGINVTEPSPGTYTIANTAPDQTVAITAGTGISATGAYPNFTISSSLTAVNNDVQIASVAGGYSVDVGSAPGRGVVKITNGTGDNLNAVNSVAIGGDAGFTSQGVVGGANGSSIAIGVAAGRNNQQQQAIAIGRNAGLDNQRVDSIAIGVEAARTDQQSFSVAIGGNSGNFQQQGQCVAIGNSAGRVAQAGGGVCIGSEAGRNSQGSQAIAIGIQAGLGNAAAPFLQQGLNSIAIGAFSGRYGQNEAAIAIGFQSAQGNIGGTSIQPARSIAIGSNCETPGAVDRLAFKAEAPITPDVSNQQALSALLPLQWNGTLYRLPALASNATDFQPVTLTNAGGTQSWVNDGAGPALAVKGVNAGSNVTITDNGTALTINSSGSGFGARIYGFVQMVDNTGTGRDFAFTQVFQELLPVSATYYSSLSAEFTNPLNSRLQYTGATTRDFKVSAFYSAVNTDGYAIAIAKNAVVDANTENYLINCQFASLDTVMSLAQNDVVSIYALRIPGSTTKTVGSVRLSVVALN